MIQIFSQGHSLFWSFVLGEWVRVNRSAVNILVLTPETVFWCDIKDNSILLLRYLLFCFSFADIFPSGKVHIWTWCKISGIYHIPYCCSSCSFLCLCCQKTDGWFFTSLGNIYNGCCCCVHSICEFSLSLTHTRERTHTHTEILLLSFTVFLSSKFFMFYYIS